MKNIKYKIVAVITAVCFTVSVFCIPVSADSLIGANIDFTGSMMSTYSDFFKNYLNLLIEYYKGNLTDEQLDLCIDQIIENRNEDLDSNLQNLLDNIDSIIDSGGSLGDVADNILDFLESIGVLVEIDETVENVDMRGYGVMLVTTHKDTGLKYSYWGATYAVWNPETNQCRFVSDDGIVVTGGFSDWWKERAFEHQKSSPYTTSISQEITASYLTYQWYGDVRIGDPFDTSNDDNLPSGDSSDPETDQTTDNTDGLTDEDIIKLLEELLEKLQLEFPDLSSLEGLLEAIYHRLGTLDSDNDNDLLSRLLTSINNLESSVSNNFNLNFNIDSLFGDFNIGKLLELGDITLKDILSGNKVLSDNIISVYFTFDSEHFDSVMDNLKTDLEIEFEFIKNIHGFIDYYIEQFESLWE